jgi:hypothetical protein
VGLKKRVIGQCHPPEEKDGVHELFISPVLDKPIDVVGTLMHEMAHVIAGAAARHGKDFIGVCNRAGLTEGKPFSRGPGSKLKLIITKIAEEIGAYPHQAITPRLIQVVRVPKAITLPDGTVAVITGGVGTVECECGCKARISGEWLEKVGPPVCGCGLPMGVK